jgi:hypothetical protein
MHDQFQLRLENHHLLAATKAECGHPSELEVTRPVVRERLLICPILKFVHSSPMPGIAAEESDSCLSRMQWIERQLFN